MLAGWQTSAQPLSKVGRKRRSERNLGFENEYLAHIRFRLTPQISMMDQKLR